MLKLSEFIMNGNTVAVLPDAIAKGQTITQMIPLLHVTMKIRVLHVANGSSKKKIQHQLYFSRLKKTQILLLTEG